MTTIETTVELVKEGERDCLTCGKPHNAYREPGSRVWGSWADLYDGHVYRPEPWETIARRLIEENETLVSTVAALSGRLTVHEHASALRKLADS